MREEMAEHAGRVHLHRRGLLQGWDLEVVLSQETLDPSVLGKDDNLFDKALFEKGL